MFIPEPTKQEEVVKGKEYRLIIDMYVFPEPTKQEEVVKGKEYRIIIDMCVFSRAHEAGGGGQG